MKHIELQMGGSAGFPAEWPYFILLDKLPISVFLFEDDKIII